MEAETPLTAREVLGLWARFGILAGVAETAVLAVAKLALGQFLWLGPHVVWMAPLVSVATFLVLGTPFAVLAAVLPARGVPVRPQVFVAALIAAAGAVSILPGLHWAAVLALALGVAVQASRALATTDRWRSAARPTGIATAAVLPLAALAVVGWFSWEEWRARPAGAAQPGTPSVLLITLDTERSASLDLYGHERPTSPELSSFASSGVTFDLAFATAPWTLDTHATLLTGRYPHELSTDWESAMDDRHPTLGEYLSSRGYATGAFVANLFYCGREFGLDRGFAHFEGITAQPQELVLSTALGRRLGNSGTIRRLVGFYDILARKSAGPLTDDFLDWVADVPAERPFFGWINYFDAHELYLPPEPYDTVFATTDEEWDYSRAVHRLRNHDVDSWRRFRSEAAIDGALGAYEGAIAYLDGELDRLFDELDEMGRLDNTVVVVTSDHGEQFGEHGLDHHANSLYTQVLRVPLVIRFPPGVPGDTRIERPVTLRDLPATIVSLAGLDGSPFPGEPLDRLWDPDQAFEGDSPVLGRMVPLGDRPSTEPWLSVVVDGRWHYVVPPSGEPEVYDLVEDVDETTNLAPREEMAPLLPRFRAALDAAWRPSDDPLVAGVGGAGR